MDTWKTERIAVVDTETTGFGEEARIIDIAICIFQKGQVVEEWSTLVWPESVDWEDAQVVSAMNVNGLTMHDLLDCPRMKEVLPIVFARLSGCKVWAAHNTPFDMRMIRQERLRLVADGYDKWADGSELLPSPKLLLDTMTLDVVIGVPYAKRRLDEVCKRYGVTNQHAHRAIGDAMACGEVLTAMIPELPHDWQQMRDLQRKGNEEWKRIVEKMNAKGK